MQNVKFKYALALSATDAKNQTTLSSTVFIVAKYTMPLCDGPRPYSIARPYTRLQLT